MAGVMAVETAVAQIQHGQGDVFLVGGAYIAERADMILLMAMGKVLHTGEQVPVWAREETGGGMIMGSGSAFLILESKEHAQARGVKPYARIDSVVSDRSNRQAGAARTSAEGLLNRMSGQLPEGPLPVLSGCSGVQPQLTEEREFLDSLSSHNIEPAVRGVTSVLGTLLEAQFPVSVALASLAISKAAFFDPFDSSGVEQKYSGEPERVLISNWGHWRGESLALISKPDVALREGD
jgi:3-oxoacyl-[acyl-carrier-protein] synthase II